MKLDKKLNLVLALEYGETTLYVHSTPISREIFETNYLVIAKTFAKIHGEGLSAVTGPRVAFLVLKQVAKDMNRWEGPDGIANTLVAEIVRLTNLVMPSETGWKMIPFQEALNGKLIDEDDMSEVLNAIVFFTVGSSMYPRRDLNRILELSSSLWGGRSVESNSTEFAASLPMSTATGNIGVKKPVGSSVPR